jgi:hypothetical protein
MLREIKEAKDMQAALEQREEQGRKEVAAVIDAVMERGQVLRQLEEDLHQGQDKLAQLEVTLHAGLRVTHHNHPKYRMPSSREDSSFSLYCVELYRGKYACA